MHILLVEPDTVLAKSYVLGLKQAGFSPHHAVSAQQAIQYADEQMPDVVVVSLEMARHNGIEFLYEFQSYPEWQAIPAILLTSLPTAEALKDDILHEQLNVHAVLLRSQTSVADLTRAIQRVMQRQGA